MKKRQLILLLLAFALFSGCSSKSNFYQLHPKTVQDYPVAKSRHAKVIGIAEVEVSEYLKKSEVVTRLSAGRVHVHNNALWAGSLASNIQSVLLHNISAKLPKYTLLSYPWEEPIDDQYRIYVSIDRFDGYESGEVTLEGRWSIVNKETNTVLHTEPFRYQAKGGESLDAIVDTQSQLLDRLSQRIASQVSRHI